MEWIPPPHTHTIELAYTHTYTHRQTIVVRENPVTIIFGWQSA